MSRQALEIYIIVKPDEFNADWPFAHSAAPRGNINAPRHRKQQQSVRHRVLRSQEIGTTFKAHRPAS